MGSIEAALAALESLKPGDKINYTQSAAKYSVERTMLVRRHQGVSTSRATQAENQRALHPHQEQELLQYIERLTRQGLPPTRSMIRNFGSQIAKKELGIHWVDRYIQHYRVDL
jgi:phage protein D